MTTSPLLVGATLAAAADPARVDAVVREAAVGGQPVVDALLDRAGVDESAFLSSLAAQLQWPWQLTVHPDGDDAAQLKKACPTRLALRHRLNRAQHTDFGPREIRCEPSIQSDTIDRLTRAQRCKWMARL